ncbi:YfjI family protein [Ruegeria sp. 2012CJ41-6]|uniref:YfjI family protein n=1 Tax=Ruegeria spongiae TaxID=2942209 RepID=A0ABT0Q881_9RHOB|nr:YfjI family protein [Ruegeria spongiae]MCL6286023.1 YfjI family protein [Ruegeria spongiae]
MTMIQPKPFIEEGPQPLLREIPPGDPYPVDALGPLRAAVLAVQDKTQAPVALAAQSALSVASLAVQAFADVETLGGTAPASLFCLTVARSGERKSGCDKLVLVALRQYEHDKTLEFQIDFARYEAAKKLWDARQANLIKAAAGSGGNAIKAQADLEAMTPPPKPPVEPSRTSPDPTFEGLVKSFFTGFPAKGLFTDEGGSFFGGHAMNSENKLKTCSGLSSFWDGSPINRTRAGDGVGTLWGRRLAAHMMATPVAVRPLLADPIANGQGFLARFLITEPQSEIGYRLRDGYDPKSDLALNQFGARLTSIISTEPPLKEGTQNQLELEPLAVNGEARKLLWDYYCATEQAQRPGGDLSHVTAHASKSAEQAARIAAVMTLWGSLDAREVSAEAMSNGIALAQYYLSEASRLADAAVISEKTEQAEALRLWLQSSWTEPEILPGDVAQLGPNGLRETAKAKEAMSTLAQYGHLVQLPEGTEVRGRSRKLAFRVVRGS